MQTRKRVPRGQSGIYLVFCEGNNLCYIGQSVDMLTRMSAHRQAFRRGDHDNRRLQNAYNKYGSNSMEYRPLIRCNIEQLTEYEQRIYDMFSRHHTMANAGPIMDTPMLGVKRKDADFCRETLAKHHAKAIAQSAYIRRTDVTIASRVRECGRKQMAVLRNNPEIEARRKKAAAEAQSRPDLVEHRREIMKARIANGWRPWDSAASVETAALRRRRVINTNTGEVFASLQDAAVAYSVKESTIHRWVNGRSDNKKYGPKYLKKPEWSYA